MLTEVALTLIIACSKHSVLISNLLTLLRFFLEIAYLWTLNQRNQKPEPCGFRVVSSIILATFPNLRHRRLNCCVTFFHVCALQWPVHTIFVRQTTSTSENNDGFPFENNGIVCLRRRVDAVFNGTLVNRSRKPGTNTQTHTQHSQLMQQMAVLWVNRRSRCNFNAPHLSNAVIVREHRMNLSPESSSRFSSGLFSGRTIHPLASSSLHAAIFNWQADQVSKSTFGSPLLAWGCPTVGVVLDRLPAESQRCHWANFLSGEWKARSSLSYACSSLFPSGGLKVYCVIFGLIYNFYVGKSLIYCQ